MQGVCVCVSAMGVCTVCGVCMCVCMGCVRGRDGALIQTLLPAVPASTLHPPPKGGKPVCNQALVTLCLQQTPRVSHRPSGGAGGASEGRALGPRVPPAPSGSQGRVPSARKGPGGSGPLPHPPQRERTRTGPRPSSRRTPAGRSRRPGRARRWTARPRTPPAAGAGARRPRAG